MAAIGFILIAFGILAVALIWLNVADRLDKRRVNRCLQSISIAECPRCKNVVGANATATAKQRMIKFRGAGNRILRGQDYPSRIVMVVCPHCSAVLDFRLDGSLFSCDKIVASQNRQA